MGREDEIRAAAYDRWEKEGCPHGKDCEHWYMAEAEWEEKNGRSTAKEAPEETKPSARRKTRVSAASKKSSKT